MRPGGPDVTTGAGDEGTVPGGRAAPDAGPIGFPEEAVGTSTKVVTNGRVPHGEPSGELPIADAATDAYPVRTQPWGVTAADEAEVLRALRFRHFKWDTYATGGQLVLPEAIVLSRAAHEHVVAVVESLNGALARFERRARRTPELLSRLGIPPELHGIIADEREETLQLARYDLFPTEDGRWMVSEFNEDVPGGFNEAEIPRLLGEPGDGLQWEGDLRRSFVGAFQGLDTVALLYATAYSEDLQHMLILERWLAEAGHHTVLASPAHLHVRWRRPRVLGTPIDAAFRFYPAEWMPRLPNLDVWRRIGPRLRMMNPIHRLIRQSKRMFSHWANDPDLNADDRDLVARHCPLTFDFDPALVEALKAERERWVLKHAFGRMGDTVVIGALQTDGQWAAALGEAVRSPHEYCVQEKFHATPLMFRDGPLYPAIGAYLVNGRFAGYYSRAARAPLITHEAFHVATLVESA